MDLASGRQPVYAFFFSCRLFPCQSELRMKVGRARNKETHPGETVCRARARGLIMPMLLITAAAAYFVDAGCSPLKKINWLRRGRKNVTGVSPDAPKIKAAASFAFVTLRMCRRSVQIFVPRCYQATRERESECVFMGSGNGGMREWARKYTHIDVIFSPTLFARKVASAVIYCVALRFCCRRPAKTDRRGAADFLLHRILMSTDSPVTDNLIIAPARQHNVIGAIFLPLRLCRFFCTPPAENTFAHEAQLV